MSMTEREHAARAIGYLEGLSAFLWSLPDRNDSPSICPEACGYYDDQVELLRKAIFDGDKLNEQIKKRDVLINAMWTRIMSEYPNGGFPDMGMLEEELKWMGVIPCEI